MMRTRGPLPTTAVSAGTRLKICGVTDAPTYLMLEEEGVDFIGLWFRMPGGKHTLDESRLEALLADARRAGKARSTPVLVTLTAEPDWLADVAHRHALRCVQLHGFQLPHAIRALKQELGELSIFKTLHVRNGICIDARFVDAYLAAGVDAFVLDNFASPADIGSTGQRFDPRVLAELSTRHPEARWICAGGITAEYVPTLRSSLPNLFGIDVDSGARIAGRIDRGAVSGLAGSLRAPTERRLA